jgi:hypothetical protein
MPYRLQLAKHTTASVLDKTLSKTAGTTAPVSFLARQRDVAKHNHHRPRKPSANDKTSRHQLSRVSWKDETTDRSNFCALMAPLLPPFP